jgi:serine/threonine protein kinase
LGRYFIEEEIGKGAMGTVYRARHAMLRRPAAIKLMNTTHFDATALNRFEREAQATSQLQSPHTVHVYDYGITTNGVLYYVMEYLNGMTLRDLVEKFGPQPESRVIHILCQVCGSLEEAHSKGLIHRDIKPDNIALCESGGVCDFAKVLDFGLVHFLNGKVDDGEQKFLAGTPEYMSPEAIHRPSEIDHRTDVYALGAVGYYLLTGQPVFPITVVPQLLKAHLETQPEPPSQRVGRSIDDDLEAVILNCLEKAPDMRPPSAIQLAALLSACQAANKWSFEEARDWWDTNRHSPVMFQKIEHDSQPSLVQKPTRAYALPPVSERKADVTAVTASSIQLRPNEAFLLSSDLDEIQYGETFIIPIPAGVESDAD